MTHEEFAFFNQQLAAMLREGIPLEGALRQLCSGMRRGKLRSEFQKLEADLARGVALDKALANRKLPELYVRMVQVGSKSNDLPGVLVMLADHYHRSYSLWTRLKGLMVYPLIVLVATFAMSVLFAMAYAPLARILFASYSGWSSWNQNPSMIPDNLAAAYVWIFLPICVFGLLLVSVLLLLAVPGLRRRVQWILPAFKEANLARFASCMELGLQGGNSLREALVLARTLDQHTPLGKELATWEARLAAGCKHLRDIGEKSRIVPPLFFWLVDSSGEDWEHGFRQARQIYAARATARSEMFLYAALPISILTLAAIIVAQLVPIVRLCLTGLMWL